MTADMVIRFFENHGWIMTFLATSGIVFVGCLKATRLFTKLNPRVKKYVYFACSCLVSIVACTIYLCVKNAFIWADWGMTTVCIIGYTMAIYGLYENSGVRSLLKKVLFTPIRNLLKNVMLLIMSTSISKEKMMLHAKDLGSDILAQLADEIRQNESLIETVSEDETPVTLKENNGGSSDAENAAECNQKPFLKNNFFS